MDLLLKISKNLKPYLKDNFLLGVSGGLDSIALLESFCHMRKNFQVSFSVAHIHHGPSEVLAQQDFRFQAYEQVQKICFEKDIPFFSNFSGDQATFLGGFPVPLKSESDFRNYRRQELINFQEKNDFDWVVVGHHQDDLLETRLLRMIRGVGEDALQSMDFVDSPWMRPLLNFSRKNLEEFMAYLNQKKWLEDPSNRDQGPLRNWLRHEWLPSLEAKSPGALKSMARSLDLILEERLDHSEALSCIRDQQILLPEFLALSPSEKKWVLAGFMRSLGLKGYGQSHINEVIKRIDTSKKSHTFQLLRHQWVVDAGRMKVLGLG